MIIKSIIMAIVYLFLQIVSFFGFMQPKPDETKLSNAIAHTNIEVIKEVVDDENIDVTKWSTILMNTNLSNKEFTNCPIMEAITYQDMETVVILLDSINDYNYEDSSGHSLLQVAAMYDIELMEYLIDKGADINKKCSNGFTLLEYVVDNCLWNALNTLIKYKPIVTGEAIELFVEKCNIQNKQVIYALGCFGTMLKSVKDRYDSQLIYEIFVKKRITGSKIESSQLIDLFGTAAFCGNKELELVIKCFENDDFDVYQLYRIASYYGNLDNIIYLENTYPELQKYRDNEFDKLKYVLYTIKNENVENGSHIIDSIRGGNINVLNYFLDTYNGTLDYNTINIIMFLALQYNTQNVIAYMHDSGFDIITPESTFQAVTYGRIDYVKEALEVGISPNTVFSNHTLFEIAIMEKNTYAINLLLDYGVDLTTDSAKQAFVTLCGSNELDIVKRLISLGMDVNYVDTAIEATPIGNAIQHGRLEMVRLLFDSGLDLDLINEANGLVEYARKNNSYRVTKLVESRCN